MIVPGNILFTKISSKGQFMLGATAGGMVYSWGILAAVFQLGRSGSRDIPAPLLLRINGVNAVWGLLAPITHLFSMNNYGIFISKNTRWFSWGLGLYNTNLPSSTLPLENNQATNPLPFLVNDQIGTIDGSDSCLVCLFIYIILMQIVLSRAGNLYYLTLDFLSSGSLSSRNSWEPVKGPESLLVNKLVFSLLAVGKNVAIISDVDGNVYSFLTGLNMISPFISISV